MDSQPNQLGQLSVIKNGYNIGPYVIGTVIIKMIERRQETMSTDYDFHHVAGLWPKGRFIWEEKYCLGENSDRESISGCCYSTHAEMEAIERLPPQNIRGKKIELSMIIIRVSKNGTLKNSTPCAKCIQRIDWINKKTTYVIRNIYYSDQNGNIIVTKFSELYDNPNKHITGGFRRKTK